MSSFYGKQRYRKLIHRYYYYYVTDEPPPAPKPPLKMVKKESVEVEEKFETYIKPDEPPPEQFQRRIEPDEEPPKAPQIDYAGFERVITELFPQNKKFFLMYNKVPWTLHIRKEVGASGVVTLCVTQLSGQSDGFDSFCIIQRLYLHIFCLSLRTGILAICDFFF